jgi:alkanesulfonate monooxygenase SsuD/methylene tetrahydromethanopterin reductase-like flavin-dependent oxidoreductase (luciferase family)
MRIGVRLTASIPSVPGALVLEWARRAEAGPFASLGVIDRVVYPNCEPLVTLGAAAALTQQVRLVSSVLIDPAHDAALLAKQAATVDVLSTSA